MILYLLAGGDDMRKKLAISVVGSAIFLLAATGVLAAPNNPQKAENNPNVVAYYPTGIHAIPRDPIEYVEGTDLVLERGKSGQIHAWYTGKDGHGIHSVWNLSQDGTCKNKHDVLIEDAYPEWGDYLVPGADYCVKTNEF